MTVLAALVGEDAEQSGDQLKAYLLMAGQAIQNIRYPFAPDPKREVESQYELLQCRMAAYDWNKRGAEGQTSHSENGVSRGYENGDYPASLVAQITPMGKVF